MTAGFRQAIVCCLLLCCSGCSSLGLSCFPTGHYLTPQAEEIVARSPLPAQIPRELEQSVVPVHYLQPGDVVLIEPVEFDNDVRIPADQQVLVDGSVDLGGFGRVVVAGLTLELAESLIEQTIFESNQQKTRVNVRLLEPVHRYYVLGEVNSPGSYPLEGHETVLDGILAAGGLTSSAAPCKILLARPTSPASCRVTLPICYREITQLGDSSTNYQLQPGDRIFVSSRSWSEELMFWQATKTCPRCCNCQAACVDPAVIGYPNPMVHMASGSFADASVLESDLPESDALESETLVPETAADPPIAVSRLSPLAPSNDGQPPARLPTTADGELDFGPTASQERFDPLWITPASKTATRAVEETATSPTKPHEGFEPISPASIELPSP